MHGNRLHATSFKSQPSWSRGKSAAPRQFARAVVSAAALLVSFVALPVVQPANAQATSPAPATVDQGAKREAPRRVVLRFVTEADFPPFNFYDEDGVLTGFNIDLARAVCVELKTACDIKVREWSALLDALTDGKADAAVAGHAVDAHALLKVDFTDRYFHTPGRFAVRRDAGNFKPSVDGLEGKRIGVATGTTHEAFIRQFFLGSRVNIFDDPDKAREALVSGQVDVVFDDAISLAFWLNGTLSKQCCRFLGGAFLEPKYFGDGIAIAVSRRDPALKQEINDALKKLRESGRFDRLVSRYFPFRLY